MKNKFTLALIVFLYIFTPSLQSSNTIWNNKGIDANISAASISSEFRYLAGFFSGQPKKIKVIDLITKKSIFEQEGTDIYPIVFSPDSKLLAVFSRGINQLDIWNISENKKLYTEIFNISSPTMKFSPDGSKFFIANIQSKSINMYYFDIASFKMDSVHLGQFANNYFNYDFAISPDNQRFIITTQNNLYVCNFQDTTKKYLPDFSNGIINWDYTSDGKSIVVTTGDADPTIETENEICIISTTDYSKSFSLKTTEYKPSKMFQSKDGQKFIIFFDNYYLKILDINTQKIERKTNNLGQYPFYCPFGDNKVLGVKYDKVYELNLDNLNSSLVYKDYAGDMCTGPINDIKISPNNKYIATGGEDGIIKLWNIDSGKLLNTLVGHLNPVKSIGFSKDSKYLASVSGSPESRLNIWDLVTNTIVYTKSDFSSFKSHVTFSPNGELLILGSALDSSIVLRTSDWKEIIKLDLGEEVNSVQFSADGKFIAISNRYIETISILNTLNWKKETTGDIFSPDWINGVTDISFSQNNDIIAVACGDNNVRVYSIPDWKFIKLLPGLTKFSDGTESFPADDMKISFINGSKYLLGTFGDFAKIWNITTVKDIFIYEDIKNDQENYGNIACMAVHNKAEFFVSGSSYGDITKWLMPDLGTDVKDNFLAKGLIFVIPNPANTQITISISNLLSDVVDCRIYSNNLSLIKTFALNSCEQIYNNYTYDISSLSAGVYFLQISQGKFHQIQKFVKY
jgi:WD40 repeat protein